MSEFFSYTTPLINQEIDLVIIECNNEDDGLAVHTLKKSHIANDIVHLVGGSQSLDFTFGTEASWLKYPTAP